MTTICIILGAGGHARVLIDSLCSMGNVVIHGILDTKKELWGKEIMGVQVLGGDNLLKDLRGSDVTSFVIGVGGSSNNLPRKKLFEQARALGFEPLTVRHARTIVSEWAEIGLGSQLMPGSIVNAGARLGVNVIVNSGAIVEHDCVIEDHVHIATGARLAGTVHIGAEAHIGIGSVIRQGINIGERAVVGAGAVVVKDVLPGVVVVGNPAIPLIKGTTQ